MTTWQIGSVEKAHVFFWLWNIIICCPPNFHIYDGWENVLTLLRNQQSWSSSRVGRGHRTPRICTELHPTPSMMLLAAHVTWISWTIELWQTDLKMNLNSWGNGNRNSPYDWRLIDARRNCSAISKTSRTRIALVQRVMEVPSDRSLSDCSNTTDLIPTLFPTIPIWSKIIYSFYVSALVPLPHPKQIQQKGKNHKAIKSEVFLGHMVRVQTCDDFASGEEILQLEEFFSLLICVHTTAFHSQASSNGCNNYSPLDSRLPSSKKLSVAVTHSHG